MPLCRWSTCSGSPPRMRGKVFQGFDDFQSLGITPAYAGKSSFTSVELFSTWDHPRVCGEKRHTSRFWKNTAGSPPRMRGKVFELFRSFRLAGITPAYAGKSLTTFDAGKLIPGSPPRMRGKAFASSSSTYALRITPAYAGKRMTKPWHACVRWDHPRVCGEK